MFPRSFPQLAAQAVDNYTGVILWDFPGEIRVKPRRRGTRGGTIRDPPLPPFFAESPAAVDNYNRVIRLAGSSEPA